MILYFLYITFTIILLSIASSDLTTAKKSSCPRPSAVASIFFVPLSSTMSLSTIRILASLCRHPNWIHSTDYKPSRVSHHILSIYAYFLFSRAGLLISILLLFFYISITLNSLSIHFHNALWGKPVQLLLTIQAHLFPDSFRYDLWTYFYPCHQNYTMELTSSSLLFSFCSLRNRRQKTIKYQGQNPLHYLRFRMFNFRLKEIL